MKWPTVRQLAAALLAAALVLLLGAPESPWLARLAGAAAKLCGL